MRTARAIFPNGVTEYPASSSAAPAFCRAARLTAHRKGARTQRAVISDEMLARGGDESRDSSHKLDAGPLKDRGRVWFALAGAVADAVPFGRIRQLLERQGGAKDVEQQALQARAVLKDDRRAGIIIHSYRAKASICVACPHLANCYPGMKKHGRQVARIVELPQVIAFHEKMETPEAKAIYRTRSKTAEFPNAWIKEKFGLRQFQTRGKVKTTQEALWASITFNIQQWIRLIWRPRLAMSSG